MDVIPDPLARDTPDSPDPPAPVWRQRAGQHAADSEATAMNPTKQTADQYPVQHTSGGAALSVCPAWQPGEEDQPIMLNGKLSRYAVSVMIDSGASGNFVSRQLVDTCGLRTARTSKGLTVTLADGNVRPCDSSVSETLRVGKYQEKMPLRVIDLPHHDFILGKPWLRTQNPHIDWRTKSLFLGGGRDTVVLRGAQPRKASKERSELQGLLLTHLQMKRAARHNKPLLLAVVRDVDTGDQPADSSGDSAADDNVRRYSETMQIDSWKSCQRGCHHRGGSITPFR